MIELGKVEYYLLAINVIGAVVYLINMFLYRHTSNGQIKVIVTITSLLGGSAGMLLMLLFFDRKIVFAIDKVNARTHRSRIRIVTLLGLSFAGDLLEDSSLCICSDIRRRKIILRLECR